VTAATRIRRIGIAVAALVVAAFSGPMLLSLLISADTVREAVKTQIHAVTGLDAVLRGDVAVSLFPAGAVTFDDVNLGDARTGAAALTAEQLQVRLRFFPLLLGRIEIADVSIVRPVISISFAADGRSNWTSHVETLARALQSDNGRVASFSEIRIADGTIVLRDQAHDIVETLSKVEFALAWPSISKSFAATGHFVWHDQPLDATLNFTDFVAALVGERSGLKIRVAGSPLNFAFDGSLSHKPTFKMEGMLSADAASLRDTLRWSTNQTPPGGGFGRFALKAQTNIASGNIALTGVNVDLDGNVGEGVLTLTTDGRSKLQGTLAADGLDLTPYISTIRLMTAGQRTWERVPLALDGLNGVDVDLRLSAARVTITHAKLGRTAVAANLRDGRLSITVGESQAYGGVVKGSFALAKSSSEGADVKAQLQFSEVDLEQCLGDLFGLRRLEGKGNLGFAIDSSGASVYELAQSLNGTATLVSRKGAITGLNVEQLLRRLERNPLSGRGDFRSGKTPFDLLTVNLKIMQGIANVEDVRIEAPSLRLGLLGSASIPARDLDLKGTAALLSSVAGAAESTVAFELPFVVQGPWDDPLMLPDTTTLIRRSGASAPLLELLKNRLNPARPASEPAATPPAMAAPTSVPAAQ